MEKENENKGNVLYVLNTLKTYSDDEHILSSNDIKELIKKDYDVNIDSRTIRRNINLLIEKFSYDISTYNDNRKGYYYIKNIDIDFTLGEIIMIINQIKLANDINEETSNLLVNKLEKQINIFDREKLKSNIAKMKEQKTKNWELVNSLEIVSQAIEEKKKIQFIHNGKNIIYSPQYIVYRKFKVLTPFNYIVIGTNNTLNNNIGILLTSMKNIKILDEECEFLDEEKNK